MEPKPKERIVFDEDSYYGDEGAEWAVNDLMERKGLTEDEVRESFTDDEVFQHAMHPARCGRWRLFPFGGSERSRPIALRSPREQESRPRCDSETE